MNDAFSDKSRSHTQTYADTHTPGYKDTYFGRQTLTYLTYVVSSYVFSTLCCLGWGVRNYWKTLTSIPVDLSNHTYIGLSEHI